MRDDAFKMCMLFDFYGDMLTEKQRELFDLYYNEDLSLAEISEHTGTTRQGVRDAIVRGRSALSEMEERLGIVSRFTKLAAALADISKSSGELEELCARKYNYPDLRALTDRIRALTSAALERYNEG